MKSGITPWMENWVGAVLRRIYHMDMLDNDKALDLLRWKSRFVIGPLTDSGYCPMIMVSYNYHVTDANQDPYSDWADICQATIELGDSAYDNFQDDLPDCGTAEISGACGLPSGAIRYSNNDNSFYAMMQGVVAAAVDSRATRA